MCSDIRNASTTSTFATHLSICRFVHGNTALSLVSQQLSPVILAAGKLWRRHHGNNRQRHAFVSSVASYSVHIVRTRGYQSIYSVHIVRPGDIKAYIQCISCEPGDIKAYIQCISCEPGDIKAYIQCISCEPGDIKAYIQCISCSHELSTICKIRQGPTSDKLRHDRPAKNKKGFNSIHATLEAEGTSSFTER
jgi:hypothetical protein